MHTYLPFQAKQSPLHGSFNHQGLDTKELMNNYMPNQRDYNKPSLLYGSFSLTAEYRKSANHNLGSAHFGGLTCAGPHVHRPSSSEQAYLGHLCLHAICLQGCYCFLCGCRTIKIYKTITCKDTKPGISHHRQAGTLLSSNECRVTVGYEFVSSRRNLARPKDSRISAPKCFTRATLVTLDKRRLIHFPEYFADWGVGEKPT